MPPKDKRKASLDSTSEHNKRKKGGKEEEGEDAQEENSANGQQELEVLLVFSGCGDAAGVVTQLTMQHTHGLSQEERLQQAKELWDDQLLKRIPNLKLGVVLMADYNDGPKEIYRRSEMTNNAEELRKWLFEKRRGYSGSGHSPHEWVLRQLEKSPPWCSANSVKKIIWYVHDEPYETAISTKKLNKYKFSTKKGLNWKNEFSSFRKSNPEVEIHTVVVTQFHGRSTHFARYITEQTGGKVYQLPTFEAVTAFYRSLLYYITDPINQTRNFSEFSDELQQLQKEGQNKVLINKEKQYAIEVNYEKLLQMFGNNTSVSVKNQIDHTANTNTNTNSNSDSNTDSNSDSNNNNNNNNNNDSSNNSDDSSTTTSTC